ncbi:MAG: indolepyruvate ferredoxin oxidoreductase subunit alpha [Chloroflexota bacterium]
MPVINEEKCKGCRLCIPYCPLDAFEEVDRNKVANDQDKCSECYVCVRKEVCPHGAIERVDLEGSLRNFSHFLSDPTETKATTGVPGRGTEESKTNDVTGRTKMGQVGIAIDMGRPGVGLKLADAEKVAMAMAAVGLEFEDASPLTEIMVDRETGKLRPEYLDVHLLSIIVEGNCSVEGFPRVIRALREVEGEIETVFSLGVISRVDAEGNSPVMAEIERLGLARPIRGKVNVGLGKPLCLD